MIKVLLFFFLLSSNAFSNANIFDQIQKKSWRLDIALDINTLENGRNFVDGVGDFVLGDDGVKLLQKEEFSGMESRLGIRYSPWENFNLGGSFDISKYNDYSAVGLKKSSLYLDYDYFTTTDTKLRLSLKFNFSSDHSVESDGIQSASTGETSYETNLNYAIRFDNINVVSGFIYRRVGEVSREIILPTSDKISFTEKSREDFLFYFHSQWYFYRKFFWGFEFEMGSIGAGGLHVTEALQGLNVSTSQNFYMYQNIDHTSYRSLGGSIGYDFSSNLGISLSYVHSTNEGRFSHEDTNNFIGEYFNYSRLIDTIALAAVFRF